MKRYVNMITSSLGRISERITWFVSIKFDALMGRTQEEIASIQIYLISLTKNG